TPASRGAVEILVIANVRHDPTSLFDDAERYLHVAGHALHPRLCPARSIDAGAHGVRLVAEIAIPPITVAPYDGAQVSLQRRHLRKRHGRCLHLPCSLRCYSITPFFPACCAARFGDVLVALRDTSDPDFVSVELRGCHVTSPRTSPCAPGASPVPPPL